MYAIRSYYGYKTPVEEGAVPSDEAQTYQDRDAMEMTLQESAPHSGFFTGTLSIEPWVEGTPISMTDGKLVAAEKDVVFIEYQDQEHIASLKEPRLVVAKADFLTGEIPDVWVAQREAWESNLPRPMALDLELDDDVLLVQIPPDLNTIKRIDP